MIRIAAVACLDPARSIHTPTFLRAVELAQDHALPKDVQITLFDDLASAGGAAQAARQILSFRPHAIVGHFASSAAQVAAPLYAMAGLKLFLPAATRADLTQNATTYRICDHDAAYVDWLCTEVKTPIHAALSDGSAHGDSVVQMVQQSPTFQPQSAPDTVLISGLYATSLQLAAKTRARHIILTDDADAPTLAADLAAAGLDLTQTKVTVAALAPKPRGPIAEAILRANPAPGTYAWETIAALQVAAQRGPTFDTVLGPLTFDTRREANPRSFTLKPVTPARQPA
ncbi:amino acid ABC transporter substrate-binding protein [Pacificoceanicola onchidii]|uniref:amino acid ABC transporter substrate-binding protein n=1 Tax=Pacificoceanicola onchidii TaxID=2562685 RepID=UPI0010A6401B|nr:amino acid ABC transporter substrate-binding protein [Pacificoceanicola onchidii]